jgi:hypothetical protein
MPAFAKADVADLDPFVQLWHQQALPAIRTKPFEKSRSDFNRGWETAWPLCGSAIDIAFKQALRHEPPDAARYRDPRMRILVGICWHLQKYAGGRPFYPSTRDVARLQGIEGKEPQVTAWRMLRKLERDGILLVVERGTPGVTIGGRATSYRFAGSYSGI